MKLVKFRFNLKKKNSSKNFLFKLPTNVQTKLLAYMRNQIGLQNGKYRILPTSDVHSLITQKSHTNGIDFLDNIS
jgi:hypothetical protein